MPAADSTNAFVPAADRALMRRLTIALIVLMIATFAISRLYLLYSHKFYDITGTAEWIWESRRISQGDALAFFAARDFDLPENRYYTKIKIFGDPEYTLYFNGVEIGGRRVGEEHRLDVFDVSALAKTGRNRMLVALRSENGVGGLIASIDIAPDYQNMIVTGRDWKIFRKWNDGLIAADVPSVPASAPLLFGRPPMLKWNYLERTEHPLFVAPKTILQPLVVSTINAALPDVRVLGGVAVTVTTPSKAVAYDFGPTHGRARLTVRVRTVNSRVVKVRFANVPSELAALEGDVQSFVVGPSERTIVDPEERRFRYVMVYGGTAKVEVLQ
jgi:hypothetical protein